MDRRHILATVLALLVLVVAAGCGKEPVTSSRAAPETTGGTTGETVAETTAPKSAPTESLQGVMDSYLLAQEEISSEGGETETGEYRVGYIVEPAEGWWEGDPQDPEWREPAAGETNHIEILPFDRETGLLIPYMDIELTVTDGSGTEIESKPLSFYYADFYHYANNFSIPEKGSYTLTVEFSSPEFRRHGDADGEGRVFTEPVQIEFDSVEIDPQEE